MHYSAEHNSIQQVGVWTNQVESIKYLNFRLQNPQKKSELEGNHMTWNVLDWGNPL